MTVDLADPSLGTLTSATFKLVAKVEGSAKGESLDNAPTTLSLDLQAEIEATASSLLLATLPVVNETFGAKAFDGVIDFGGTSGISLSGLTSTDTDTIVVTDPVLLAALVGPGTIDWTVVATGVSVGSGAGNLITQFATTAFAELSVEYTYAPVNQIPLPASVLLLVGGLGALGVVKARKRA